MASEETLRFLLHNTLERNDGLVKINQEAILAIPTILGALWGIQLHFNGTNNIPFFALITIGILLIWRYFAHYIDDDVAKNYSRILQIEKKLEIPKECSIFCGLIKSIIFSFKGELSAEEQKKYEKNAMDLSKDQKIKLIELLYEDKKMGYRGHNHWDYLSFISIMFCLSVYYINQICVQYEYVCQSVFSSIIGSGTILVILILLIALFSVIFCVFYDVFISIFGFHMKPKKTEYDYIYDDATRYVPKVSDDC